MLLLFYSCFHCRYLFHFMQNSCMFQLWSTRLMFSFLHQYLTAFVIQILQRNSLKRNFLINQKTRHAFRNAELSKHTLVLRHLSNLDTPKNIIYCEYNLDFRKYQYNFQPNGYLWAYLKSTVSPLCFCLPLENFFFSFSSNTVVQDLWVLNLCYKDKLIFGFQESPVCGVDIGRV